MNPNQSIDQSDDRRVAPSPSSIHAIVVEVLARRGERADPACVSEALLPSAAPEDRESLREAVAARFNRSVSEVADVFLDEVLGRVAAEGAAAAERVVACLNELVSQLDVLECVDRRDVFEYFAAADRVLLKLYAELRRPRPSPTRLRQLVVRYALDARRCIDAPAHQIEIRRQAGGYEIAVVAPGYSSLRSLPYPGVIVRNPFARQILAIALAEPPRYTDLMQYIEMLLGYVPEELDSADPRLMPVTPATALQVDINDSCVIYFDRRYVVDLQLVRFVNALLETPGAWVSSKALARDPLFGGVRMDRRWTKLPSPVQEVIESRTGRGYRVRLERLTELCPISSVAPPAVKVDDV